MTENEVMLIKYHMEGPKTDDDITKLTKEKEVVVEELAKAKADVNLQPNFVAHLEEELKKAQQA